MPCALAIVQNCGRQQNVGVCCTHHIQETDLALYNDFFPQPNELLRSLAVWVVFALFYQTTMPVAKCHAWTAQQTLYTIELKNTSPDKTLDDVSVAIKATYDRDVSTTTLHSWLKPDKAAKFEQLVNARGQNDAKRTRICFYPNLEHQRQLWS